MSVKSLLPIYFILVLIISTGAVLISLGPNGLPVPADKVMTVGMAILLGPSTAGILLTGLASGRAGFRELLSRLLRWRVTARWYAVALLTGPLATGVVLLTFSFFSPEYAPSILTSNDRADLLLGGILSGLIVAFFEELGWTGFAIPQMRRHRSIFATGIITGLIWGLWHFLLFWESDSFSGAFPLALLLVRLFSWLPAYRVLMTWVYDRTESLLVVILMHGSLVFTLAVIDPSLTGVSLITFILGRAAILWIFAAAVTIAVRRAAPVKLSRVAP